jgi:hypothetical protein
MTVGTISATGAINAVGNITTTVGNIQTTNGDIKTTTGSISGGTISATGAISVVGNITTTGGNIQTTTGNITTTNGSVSGGTISSTGTISAGGNYTTTNGNISTTNGNITTTNGNITASSGVVSCKSGTFHTLASTGNSRTLFNAPTVVGVHLQNVTLGGTGYGWIELCGTGSGSGYIDFTTVSTDYNGRLSYSFVADQYDWTVNGTTVRMSLNTNGLSVFGRITPSSDNILKFNEKPIINALAIINRLETVEYH